MSLKVGIVGLPNAGKSTLFNALMRKQQAAAENYPFCTIEPNTGIIPVADERLPKLAEIVKTEKIIPATVEFVDIAGLVKDSHKGEGLGNKFLAHIRETSVIVYVLRFFEDKDVVHVSGSIDPTRDLEILEEELIFADLQTIEKQPDFAKASTGKKEPKELLIYELLKKIKKQLDKGVPVRNHALTDKDKELLKSLSLLTIKPVIYLANVSEAQLKDKQLLKNFAFRSVVTLSAKVEAELIDLEEKDRNDLLKSIGVDKPALDRLVKTAYQTLGLVSFLTAGEKEVRAWTIKQGTTAQAAAGVIHSDFEKHFIKADVVDYQNFINNAGWPSCREKGLVRSEGKEYLVKDGDVVDFKVNV